MNKVSVIIPFYNAQNYLVEAIDSILTQSFLFENITLFLIDDGSTDEGQYYGKFYAKRYGNIKYFRQENKGVSSARNKGITLALDEGSEFIFFLDADDKYNKNHITQCINILEQYPESVFVSGVTHFFEGENKLDDEYTKPTYKETREINTLEGDVSPIYVGHVAQGAWRAAALEDYRFNEEFAYSEDIDFISRILLNNKFVFSNTVKYLYRIRNANDSVVNQGNLNLQWYERVWKIFKVLYEEGLEQYGYVPFFLQQTVFKNLCSLFSDKRNKKIVGQIDYASLEHAMKFIMEHTDKSIVESQELEHWQKMYFLTMKYGEAHLTRWAPLPTFVLNQTGESDAGERFGYLGSDPLTVHIINEKQGVLIIRASMRCLTYENFNLDVVSDFQTTIQEVPSPFERDKIFFCNSEIFPRKYFEIEIKLNQVIKPGNGYIRFYLKTDYEVSANVTLEFLPHSGMGYDMPFTLGDDYIVKRTGSDNTISVSTFTEEELLNVCQQLEPYNEIGEPSQASVEKFEMLKKNILGNFKAFSNRRIWLFMDRGYDVDNNAEALFRYCVTKDDGIQKYYIIPDESYADRFAGLPYMVIGTLEYKLLCCFAEKFISSYLFGGGLTYDFGVDKEQKELWEDTQNFKKLTRSFFRGDIIHVQHGVIMQDISYYLTKFDENLKMLLSVSKNEYTYIKDELSNAIDEDTLRLTGLPRLDLLEKTKNNPISQKIILFAPSFDWKYFEETKYIPGYKYSEHFNYIDSIINSPELLDLLEQNGYQLCFKPHYLVAPMLCDFQLDPRVLVVTNEINRYDLYAMADVMISDYSGIAFDFAYLKKPVIYTHFTEPKYDESYFSYERDGFGEICTDLASLIKTMTNYVANDCNMSSKYKKRVSNFYSIQDDKNCERIYQEMLRIPDTRKNIFE